MSNIKSQLWVAAIGYNDCTSQIDPEILDHLAKLLSDDLCRLLPKEYENTIKKYFELI